MPLNSPQLLRALGPSVIIAAFLVSSSPRNNYFFLSPVNSVQIRPTHPLQAGLIDKLDEPRDNQETPRESLDKLSSLPGVGRPIGFLKVKPKAELNPACAICVSACGNQLCGDHTEARFLTDIERRINKVRVVKDVEEISRNAHRNSLRDSRLLAKGHVKIPEW